MEKVGVSAQRSVTGRINKVYTALAHAWCLSDKYGGNLDDSLILCLQFQGGSDTT